MTKWETVQLKYIGNVITGNTPSTKETANYSSNDICFFKPGDLREDGLIKLGSAESFVSEHAREKIRLLPSGSILVTCIGIIGKVAITTCEGATNQQINAIVPNTEIVDPTYLGHCIFWSRHKLIEISNAAVVPIVNKSQFSSVEIPLGMKRRTA